MDPVLLTYVRLTSALDTEGTPVAVVAKDAGSQRTLIIDLIAEADRPSVEERLNAVEWSDFTLHYVPLHTWTSLESSPRTFLERVQACQQSAIEHDRLLTSVVEELQRGVEDDPSWTPEVREYVHQLRNSFCSPTDSDCSSSCVVSPQLTNNLHTPESVDIPHTTSTDATETVSTTEDAPEEVPVPPLQEIAEEPEASQDHPSEPSEPGEVPPTEAPAIQSETPSAFVKKNNRKGKSKH